MAEDFNPFTHKLTERELDEVECAMTGQASADEPSAREKVARVIHAKNGEMERRWLAELPQGAGFALTPATCEWDELVSGTDVATYVEYLNDLYDLADRIVAALEANQ